MTNQVHTKVRLVKCPRCSKILPEPVDVPLYTCGGCGTILQAKHYRTEKRSTISVSHEVAAPSNETVHARDGGESSSSDQTSCLVNGQLQLSEKDEVNDQNVSIDQNSEQIGSSCSSNLTSSSKKHDVSQQEEEPKDENSACETSLAKDTIALQNKEQCNAIAAENHNQKHVARTNSSTEAFSSIDESILESTEPSRSSPDHTVLEDTEVDKMAMVNGTGNFASKEFLVTESKETVSNGSDHHIVGKNRRELLENELSREMFLEEEIHCHNAKKIVKLAEEENSVDCIKEQLGDMRLCEALPSPEIAPDRNENSTAGRKPILQPSGDTGEIAFSNISRENVTKAPKQKIEGFDDDSSHGCNIMRSCNELIASEPINAGKKNGRPLKVVPRSLTKGSLAYDGSVSSFDGNNDPVLEQQGHAQEMSPKPNNVATKEGYHSSGFQDLPKSSSQAFLHEKLKRSTFVEEESVEENVIPVRNNRTGPNTDGFHPRVPLHWSSELGYEIGSSSSCMNDELPIHQMHQYGYKYRDLDPWFRKMNFEKHGINQRRFSEAMCYNYYGRSGELYHRSRHHHGYLDRMRGVENWSRTRSGSLNRVHYSGDLLKDRYQMRDPYIHQHPIDLRWSAQLPQPHMFRWNPYDSCPTSPQRFMEPEPYPWLHDVASVYEDQRGKDHVLKRFHLRKKQRAVKRHLCPLAGGSPFVTCYFCRKVVQLPGNFVSKRRTGIHRLKCGACSSILKFSLENGSCLSPCVVKDANRNSSNNDIGERRSS